jgi:MFS family permease
MLYIDRLGRRTILLFGVIIAEIGLILLAALFNRWPQADNHGAAVVCVMAIYFVFIGVLDPTGVKWLTTNFFPF